MAEGDALGQVHANRAPRVFTQPPHPHRLGGRDPGGNVVPRQIAQTYCDLAQKMAGVRIRASDWRERRRSLTAVAVPVTA